MVQKKCLGETFMCHDGKVEEIQGFKNAGVQGDKQQISQGGRVPLGVDVCWFIYRPHFWKSCDIFHNYVSLSSRRDHYYPQKYIKWDDLYWFFFMVEDENLFMCIFVCSKRITRLQKKCLGETFMCHDGKVEEIQGFKNAGVQGDKQQISQGGRVPLGVDVCWFIYRPHFWKSCDIFHNYVSLSSRRDHYYPQKYIKWDDLYWFFFMVEDEKLFMCIFVCSKRITRLIYAYVG